MQNGLQIAQATRAYQLGPCSVRVRHNPKPTLPVQAFARGLDLAPSCERLQAGLTEAGQALDGRALVAALGAAAAPDARAAPPGALAAGGSTGLPARASAPGQRRPSAPGGRAFQLNVELRLLRARRPLLPTCYRIPDLVGCAIWLPLSTPPRAAVPCGALDRPASWVGAPCARLSGVSALNMSARGCA